MRRWWPDRWTTRCRCEGGPADVLCTWSRGAVTLTSLHISRECSYFNLPAVDRAASWEYVPLT